MTRRLQPRALDLLALAACVGIGAVVMLGVGRFQTHHWDNGIYYFPVSLEACRQVQGGVLPAWNPYMWSGTPLLAELPTQALYPPAWLACVLAAADPSRMMAIGLALHMALAAAGMLLLGRALGLSRAGALLAAITFGANPFFAYLGTGFIVELAVFSWLPWIVLCVHRADEGPLTVAWIAAGAVATAAAWLAGQAQLWAYCAAAVVACGAGFARVRRLRAGALALGVLALGLLLVLFQIVPFVRLLASSHRASGFGIDEFLFQDIPLASWPAIFVPGLPWGVKPVLMLAPNNYAYLGTVATALAGIALLRPTRARLTVAGLAALGLWLAAGRSGGLMPLLYHVPGMALLRNPFKFFIWPVFGIALLAGFGLTDVVAAPRRVHAAAAAALVAIGVAVWLVTPASLRPPVLAAMVGRMPLVAFAVGEASLAAFAVLVLVARRRGESPSQSSLAPWIGVAAVATTALQLAVESSIYAVDAATSCPLAITNAPPDHARFAAPAPSRDQLLDSAGGFRTYWGFSTLNPTVPGDLRGAMGTYWQTEMATGYSVLTEPGYNDAIGFATISPNAPGAVHSLLADANAVLDVLATRYTLIPNGAGVEMTLQGSTPHHVRHEISPRVLLLENTRALPRVRFVDRVEAVPDRAAAIRAVVGGQTDPARTALIETAAAARGDGLQSCTGSTSRKRSGAIDLDLDCPGDAFVVLAERWDEGWSAVRNGAPVALQRTDGLVLGVALPAGRSHVELRYRPPGFRLGLLVAALVALCLTAGVVLERRGRGPSGGGR